MRKTLCGLGIALTLALSGCAPATDTPATPATPATPNASSTTSSRVDTDRDVASVDLSNSAQSNGAQGEFGTKPPTMNANGRSELPSNNTNPAGTDAGNKALEGNVAEQELAQLALTHSQNEEIREAAEMIRDDHKAAETQLRAVAGTSLPVTTLNDEHLKVKARLEGLNGPEFDKAFIDAMVADHKKVLEFYQTQAKNAPTQPMRDYFAQNAPTIKKHLDHCKKIQSSLS